ncbi:MAG: hypothetical protein ACOC44_00275 [Promethearchaeia archaeon]
MTNKELDNLIEDFKVLFPKEKLKLSEIGSLKSQLKSEPLVRYLDDLSTGSLPESVLREELFGGDSVMAKFFFGKMSPEVSISSEFIDYQISINNYNSVLLELKPLFIQEKDKKGKIKYLKQGKLDWKKHKQQIKKYSLENQYIILTNLKHWYIFSMGEALNDDPLTFNVFFEEFKSVNNIYDYLVRFEQRKDKEDWMNCFYNALNLR